MSAAADMEDLGPPEGFEELRQAILATNTITELIGVLVNPAQRVPGESRDGKWPEDLLLSLKGPLLERLRRFTWNFQEHQRLIEEAQAAARAAAAGIQHQPAHGGHAGGGDERIQPEDDLEGFDEQFANANLVALLRIAQRHGEVLVDDEIVAAVFRTPTFSLVPLYFPHALRLLDFGLRQTEFAEERVRNTPLRSAAGRWAAGHSGREHQILLMLRERHDELAQEKLMAAAGIPPPSQEERARRQLHVQRRTVRALLDMWRRVTREVQTSLQAAAGRGDVPPEVAANVVEQDLPWLIRTHLEHTLFGGDAVETLRVIDHTSRCIKMDKLPAVVTDMFLEAAATAVGSGMHNKPEIPDALFPRQRTRSGGGDHDFSRPGKTLAQIPARPQFRSYLTDGFDSKWHSGALKTLLEAAAVSLNDSTIVVDKKNPDNVDPGIFLREKLKHRDLLAFLRADMTTVSMIATYTLLHKPGGMLQQFGDVIVDAFRRGAKSVADCTATVNFIVTCRQALCHPWGDFLRTWQALKAYDAASGVKDPVIAHAIDNISDRFDELQMHQGALKRLTHIAEHYFVDAGVEVNSGLKSTANAWQRMSVLQVRAILTSEEEGNENGQLALASLSPEKLTTKPLPAVFLSASAWLATLEKSKLFDYIWKQEVKLHEPQGLLPALAQLQTLRNELDDGSILFSRLDALRAFLVDDAEVALMYRTTHDVGKQGAPFIVRTGAAAEVSIARSTEGVLKRLQQWKHLSNVRASMSDIDRVLSALTSWIAPTGQLSLTNLRSVVSSLQKRLNPVPWDTLHLKDVETYWNEASRIDDALTRHNPELWEVVDQSKDLLLWLRTRTPDDANFTSSLEMAMGRGEMECPIELWIAGKSGDKSGGRVDEEKLSQLRSVRAYLHALIFRDDDLLVDVDAAVSILRMMSTTTDSANLVTALEVCNSYHEPLAKLLADDSDAAAPDRLIHLMDPEREAVWLCESTVGEGVSLRWFVTMAGERREQTQNASELLDFQSSVVLAKTEQRTGETQAAIDKFVGQFSWLRELHQNLTALQEAGHFGYRDFYVTFKMQVEATEIRDASRTAAKELEEWSAYVAEARSALYFLNFFSMKEAWLLYDELVQVDREMSDWSFSSSLESQLDRVLRTVSALAADDEEVSRAFRSRLLKSWCEGDLPDLAGTVSGEDAGLLLTKLGLAYQAGLSIVAPVRRPVPIPVEVFEDFDAITGNDEGVVSEGKTEDAEHTHAPDTAAAPPTNPNEPSADDAAVVTPTEDAVATAKAVVDELTDEKITIAETAAEEALRQKSAAVAGLHENGLQLVVAEGKSRVVHHILSAYSRRGFLPERELCLVCKPDTSLLEVHNFLYRWRSAHTDEATGAGISRAATLYTLASTENLNFSAQRQIVVMIRRFLAVASSSGQALNPLLVVSGEAEQQHIVSQLAPYRVADARALNDDQLQEVSRYMSNHYYSGVSSHLSDFAGAGKSFTVRSIADMKYLRYVHVPVMTGTDLIVRLISSLAHAYEVNDDSVEPDAPLLLHIDLMDTIFTATNSLLFDLVYLGGVFDPASGAAYFLSSTSYLAVEVASGVGANSAINRVPIANTLPVQRSTVSSETFIADQDSLLSGMGRDHFFSARYDGTARRKAQMGREAANAFRRLQYVCIGLDIMDKQGGRFPYVFESDATGSDWSADLVASAEHLSRSMAASTGNTSLSQSMYIGKSNMIDGDRCFNLLVDASDSDRERTSLWCLWNFVNVLYWQLRDMHYKDSPLNAACMPDLSEKARKDDEQSKAKVKGDIVLFMMSTAREFATRQTVPVDRERVLAAKVSGNSRWAFNGQWIVQAFENDKHPVFKLRTFYMYYRAARKHWVIDDIIEYQGAVFSSSETEDINSRWTTSPDWQLSKTMKVKKISDKKGHNGEAVEISGLIETDEAKDNGIYLRLPEYDDIGGKPHYFKSASGSVADDRRHLFWSQPENVWQVCPTCTPEDGAFALSQSPNMEGQWRRMPPDIVEKNLKIELLTARDVERDVSRGQRQPSQASAMGLRRRAVGSAAGTTGGATTAAGVDNDVDTDRSEDERRRRAILGADSEIFDTLKKWNDSNHECILFNNSTFTVTFMSMDPEKMREKMHPNLLKHLEQNNINVGEDLNKLTNRHHAILAALTEVERSPEDASALLGGGYCLTGDNLVKMLAIFARVRTGVPVVLLGECGCGKTQLLKYLCAWLAVPLCVLDVHGGTSEADILGIFATAHQTLEKNKEMRELFVFLDEINTCAHMGLLTEVICKRSLYGRRISDKIHVLAALNPYRLRKERMNSGLVLGQSSEKSKTSEIGAILDPMAQLVYRVHPIPRTLQDFIFDFGALPAEHELLYIRSMVSGELQSVTDGNEHVINLISNLIHASQQYVRMVEGDPSACSLRDVKQCINLIRWFAQHVVSNKSTAASPAGKKGKATGNASNSAASMPPAQRTQKAPREHKLTGSIRSWFSKKKPNEPEQPETNISHAAAIEKTSKAEKKNDKKSGSDSKTANRPEDRDEVAKRARQAALMPATLLGLAFSYFYRLPSIVERLGYWEALSPAKVDWDARHLQDFGVDKFSKENVLGSTLQQIQRGFCSRFELPEGIALNQALMENLFVCTIAILNRIPIFVVGKPGSSKTLTMQIIASNLQGQQSSVEFWRRFPAIYTFPYQCSPLSDSLSIQHQFDMAVRYQKHADDCITVLLLDEVGLAELSPDMPLKVLHAMLVNPPISIVGLSNWVLDPAKMNRAICLQRPDPTADDILLTGERIMDDKSTKGSAGDVSGDVKLFDAVEGKGGLKKDGAAKASSRSSAVQWAQQQLAQYLGPLARAYHRVYINQKGRDWVGMRDYYCLIKQLRGLLISKYAELHDESDPKKKPALDNETLTFALYRDFGGKPDTMLDIIDGFQAEVFEGKQQARYRPRVTSLIEANLKDVHSRHLMVLTKNGAALPLLFGCDLLSRGSTPVLIGSEFRDDRSELHLVTQINEIKRAMAAGSTVVLVNHDDIYEALYDVLNQRFLFKRDEAGNTHKMLRLAIGSRSQLCPVKDGFKLVVIVEQQHAYEDLDLPLLNRFEKQNLVASDVLGKNQEAVCSELRQWCERVLDETGVRSYQEVFCGFHDGTVPSAVLAATDYDDSKIASDADRRVVFARVQRLLWQIALPIAMMHSKLLQAQQLAADSTSLSTFEQEYFSNHSDVHAAVARYVFSSPPGWETADRVGVSCSVLLTHSPVSHLGMAFDALPSGTLQQNQCTILQLGELTSERQLTNNLESFYAGVSVDDNSESDRVLILQCDPVVASQALVNHAMHVCVQMRDVAIAEFTATTRARRHVIFMIHLPPGIRERQRHFSLDVQRPWRYLFVDDLRPENPSESLGTVTMLQSSAAALIRENRIQLDEWMLEHYQQALAACGLPSLRNEDLEPEDKAKLSFGTRISVFHTLLVESKFSYFANLFKELVLSVLKVNGELDKHGMHTHVRMVCTDFSTGSLRQSLVDALRSLITQAMSHVLRSLDIDFNLVLAAPRSLFPRRDAAQASLWRAMSAMDSVINREGIASTAKLGGRSVVVGVDREVANFGRYGPLIGRFPFSHVIAKTLDAPTVRKQLDAHEAVVLPSQLFRFAESLYGSEVISSWNAFGKIGPDDSDLSAPYHADYLYDYVATSSTPLPGLAFKVARPVFEAVIRATWPFALHSPAHIHAAVWANESRLFRFGQFLASSALGARGRQVVFETIVNCPAAAAGTENANDDTSIVVQQVRDMMRLDAAVVHAVLCVLWADFSEALQQLVSIVEHGMPANTTLLASIWLQRVGVLRDDIDDCLLAIASGPSNVASVAGKDLQVAWLRLLVARLILQEGVVPVIGSFNERVSRASKVQRRILREQDEIVDRAWQKQHGFRSIARAATAGDARSTNSTTEKVHNAALAARTLLVEEFELRHTVDVSMAALKAPLCRSALESLFGFVAPELATLNPSLGDDAKILVEHVDVAESFGMRASRLSPREEFDLGDVHVWNMLITRLGSFNAVILGKSSDFTLDERASTLVHQLAAWSQWSKPQKKEAATVPREFARYAKKQLAREAKKLDTALNSLLRRFTQEILFGTQQGFLKSGGAADVAPPISMELRSLLHDVINATTGQKKYELFMRRALLQYVLSSQVSGSEIQAFIPATIEGAMLYVQHREEILPSPGLAEQIAVSAANAHITAPLTDSVLALVCDTSAPLARKLGKPEIIQFLDAIALTHYRLRLYALDIAAREEPSLDNESASSAPRAADLEKILAAADPVGDYARVFVLKVVRSIAAIDRVGTMATAPAALYPWLDKCVDRDALAKRGGGTAVSEMISAALPDPFVWAAEDWTGANMTAAPFDAMAAAVRSIAADGSAPAAVTAAEKKKEAIRLQQAVEKAQKAHDEIVTEQRETYHTLLGVVRACATSNALTQPFEDWLKDYGKNQSSSKLARVLLPAALFQTCVVEADNCSRGGIGNLIGVLARWFKKNAGASASFELAFLTWLAEGAQMQSAAVLDDEGRSHENPKKRRASDRPMLQVLVHSYMMALDNTPWLWRILSEPAETANTMQMPSAPEDPFQTAVRASGYVGWYRCPKGHPYSVGNCTYPMEVAHCPTCGAEIGGRNHVPVSGVTRLENAAIEVQGKVGYCVEVDDEPCDRLSEVGLFALRFLIHATFYAATQASPHVSRAYRDRLKHGLYAANVRGRLGEGAQEADVARQTAQQKLAPRAATMLSRMQNDWKQLRRRLELGDTELSVAFHVLLRHLRTETASVPVEAKWMAIASSRSAKDQQDIEAAYDAACSNVFKRSTLKDRLQTVMASLGESNRIAVLRNIIGDVLWPKIHELVQGEPAADPYLWMLRQRVSFEHFISVFNGNKNRNVKKFPLLAAFIENEAKLPSIKFAADVLEWHRIVFSALRNHRGTDGADGMTREDAAAMSMRDVIALLPEDERVHARGVFARFAEGFNTGLGKIEMIYQCTPNPFALGGGLDLSAGTSPSPVLMSDSTPVVFALPSCIEGDADARGLCTIALLNWMQRSHDEVYQQFQALSGNVVGAAEARAGGLQSTDRSAATDNNTEEADNDSDSDSDSDSFDSDSDDVADEATLLAQHARRRRRRLLEQRPAIAPDVARNRRAGGAMVRAARQLLERPAVPPVSYLTPTAVVQKHLLSYDRERDFLPLLRVFNTQSIQYGAGGALDYVLDRLEQALARTVFAGIRPLNLQISHFAYRGDVQTTSLSKIKEHVAQEELEASVLTAIWAEVDTQSGLAALLGLLETVVSFLVQAGSHLDPSTSLQEFVLRVLMMSPTQWEVAGTPTVRSRVCLKHIQSLFLYLDGRQNGSPLDNVVLAYREALPSVEARLIRQAASAGNLKLDELIPVLRDLMIGQLCEAPANKQQPSFPLKEWLEYMGSGIEDEEWFEKHLSNGLLLSHAFSTFELLEGLARGE